MRSWWKRLMKMRGSAWMLLVMWAGMSAVGQGSGGKSKQAVCERAVLEGEVAAGNSYEQAFTPELKFLLEPIASGWIVRVVAVGSPREAHDFAGLATPPYESVTPLAVSTDFSFRAQDAVGWNPRRFQYAATLVEFRRMDALYGPATAGDAKAASALAALVTEQPQAVLTILDAHIVPGANDQAQMAAAVASHFETTPHTVEQSAASPLGRVTWMRFRVELDLRAGTKAAAGVKEVSRSCSAQPTVQGGSASQPLSPGKK